MTFIRIVLVVAVLTPLLNGCSSPNNPVGGSPSPNSDKDKLQGEWTVISAEEWGKGAINDLKSVTFSGNEMTQVIDSGKIVDRFQLDPSSAPKRIDLFPKADDGNFLMDDKSAIRGIYELKGDELTICHCTRSQQAPTEMKTPGTITLTLKRKR